MLTRLEVDGFKNLVDFKIDLGPCTCIAGPNGLGKSNIFDAIHFLSLLADHSIIEAATLVRTAAGDFEGLDDLFFRSGKLQRDSFKIAAEMLIPLDVADDFGRPCRATSTFLRYEVEIGRRVSAPDDLHRPFDIELRSETLTPIRKGDAGKRLRFPHSKPEFRDRVVQNRRFAKSGYIGTVRPADGEEAEIVVYQDGGSRGPGQRAPARMAPRTIVGTTSTIATPTVLAARREMQSWRLLSLEPSAMRKPDRLGRDPDLVSDSGEHLAAALYRLKRTVLHDDDAVGRIAARLSELVPVRDVDVVRDDTRQLLTLSVTEENGQRFSAGAISDGTLRFLALAILAEDPEAQGLMCIEEPENGIHPTRLPSMMHLVWDLAVDASEKLEDNNVVRQVIVATHSPYFLQLQQKDDVLIARENLINCGGEPSRVLRCYPLKGTWRVGGEDQILGLGDFMLTEYLRPPEGAQLKLPLQWVTEHSAPVE